MATSLVNHLRIPGRVPKVEGLEHLEQVEATFEPYGGKWLVLARIPPRDDGWVYLPKGRWST